MRFLVVLAMLLTFPALGQETFPYNGVEDKNPQHFVIVNARIIPMPGQVIENGMIEVKDGVIVKVAAGSKAGKDAVVIDARGQYIYPAFIDAYSTFGINPPASPEPQGQLPPQMERATPGNTHWNESIHPETEAALHYRYDDGQADAYRKAGFAVVNTHLADGLARGTSVITDLSGKNPNASVLSTHGAMHFGFAHKGSSRQSYPSSLMGNIALLRQTFIDAAWYRQGGQKAERNLSLEAWNEHQGLPMVFEALDYQNVLRCAALAGEFGVKIATLGRGDEYAAADAIAKTGVTMIVPLAFPKPVDIQDPYDGMLVPLSDLKHWELAPYNAAVLHRSKVPFMFTAFLNKNKPDFLANLREAHHCGLPEDAALRALTVGPAEFLRVAHACGTLEAGKQANFLVVSGDLFSPESVIRETWVSGQRFVHESYPGPDIRGTFTLNVGGRIRTLQIEGKAGELKAVVLIDTAKSPALVQTEGKRITVAYSEKDTLNNGVVRLSGVMHLDAGAWDGQGQWVDGTWISWNAIRKAKATDKNGRNKSTIPIPSDSVKIPAITYPLVAYGRDSAEAPRTILIKNGTIWTSESMGIIQASILIKDGKIVKIGDILDTGDRDALIIDATGKHITAGIIDEHSHIANSGGVNEGGESVSAEVRLGDVVDATDINIYRQLAGGVTCAQILHGSANPIGGQSAIIKLKWGAPAQEMLLPNQPGFIKFALGENVKQSNWGDMNVVRFPQTRMGVEQVFYDAFLRAREYEREWKAFLEPAKKRKDDPETVAPRRDLELEALLEILNKTRFVTCHSYVQSEIVMLMRVADSMGFTLNTFTHILEGYKVADKMKAHGAGASSFSDWWAYKYEVKDAIPHNASVLNQMGIVTAINSDDAEMARRLNQEAAKGVKYGGMSEEDALKMITINPAKLLHIDDRTGSLKEGKDADIVIWSGHPLSVYSYVETTIVDGTVQYDVVHDKLYRKRDAAEKTRLLGEMMKKKQEGAEMRPLFPEQSGGWNCKQD
jgi:imidazolonepropionase-like amidohydrolase